MKKIVKHINKVLDRFKPKDYFKTFFITMLVNLNLDALTSKYEGVVNYSENPWLTYGLNFFLFLFLQVGIQMFIDYRKTKDKVSLDFGRFIIGIPILDAIFKMFVVSVNPTVTTSVGQTAASVIILIMAAMSSFVLNETFKNIFSKDKKEEVKKESENKPISSFQTLKRTVRLNIDDIELDEMLDNFNELQPEVSFLKERR